MQQLKSDDSCAFQYDCQPKINFLLKIKYSSSFCTRSIYSPCIPDEITQTRSLLTVATMTVFLAIILWNAFDWPAKTNTMNNFSSFI